ncbi:MAG: hypothetical protein ABSE58_10665 [Candidatus Limnocylindrales bacterium]|jgi:hypothetical protein
MVERWAGFDWRRALRIAGQIALAAWFAYWAWQTIRPYFESFPYHLDMLGFDARIYLHAAQAWLAGGDPWTAYASQHSWAAGAPDVAYYFTGPPPTVLAFVPFSWLPDSAFTVGWMALTIGAAFYTIRRLSLPAWWVLFPPLAQAVFVGNPHVVCLALILSGSSVLRAIAPAAKAYAVLPMIAERQWHALGLFAVAGALSVVILWPLWAQYATDYPQIQAWITNATWGGFSAARDPRLFVIVAAALGALWLVDRRAVGWLAVPALWPAAEYFYATFALPLRSPWLVAVLAVPGTQAAAFVPWTIAAYAVVRLAQALGAHYAPEADLALLPDEHSEPERRDVSVEA